MKRNICRFFSLLLALMLAFGMVSVTGFAAEGTLTFTLPQDAYDTNPNVRIDLYSGIPPSISGTNLDKLLEEGVVELIHENITESCPLPEKAGSYFYHVYGNGYYNTYKLFNITENDIAAKTKSISVTGGKVAGNGFEPMYRPEIPPIVDWTDEILAHFSIADQGYMTPAFDGTDAKNEFTTQDELISFVKKRSDECPYMYLFSAGKTANYNYDIPLMLITTSPLPAGATLEEAAKAIENDGKVNIWYQSQIHPNEPASGEGSLVMIDNFIRDEQYKKYLDTVNIIMIPRINPDGSYLFTRSTFGGFDMNRDHTSLKAVELALLHTAWRLFKTEVVIDTHEFTYYGYDSETGQMRNADDVQTTPASSLNNDAGVNATALEMTKYAFAAAKDADLRINHYGGTGWTTNPPIGRCYFGLLDCLSFLIETRGINAGKGNFERRVRSQEVVATAYIEYAAQHAKEIKNTVQQARENLIESGKTYNKNSVFALYQSASGNTLSPYVSDAITYALDGTEIVLEKDRALSMNDTMERSRVRPTAYVIPADHKNISKILYIMDNQGAEYFKLEPGSTATLEQYYYVGPYLNNEGKNVGFVADTRVQKPVTFENGAYVFPMDQLAANVIAAIMEPDVNDSNGYDGTLVQYNLVTHDTKTNNYPIYRFIGDNPRTNLLNQGK